MEGGSAVNTKNDTAVLANSTRKDSSTTHKNANGEKTEKSISANGVSEKKTFPLTTHNGKNVSSNMWADIGAKLKHKADNNRKDKEKRVTTYTNTIYYTASLLAFWTWCNHQVK